MKIDLYLEMREQEVPIETESFADFRIAREDEELQETEPSLFLCYKIIIALVAGLLRGSETLIVPD